MHLLGEPARFCIPMLASDFMVRRAPLLLTDDLGDAEPPKFSMAQSTDSMDSWATEVPNLRNPGKF